ncbi:hypothetical protein [Spongiactinospora sp. 9N601]|uniref:hypothetical protein n=1 Tax=Spongiactinospora sp. 9N601 TaxID=3375149 RepID=UPI003794FF5B
MKLLFDRVPLVVHGQTGDLLQGAERQGAFAGELPDQVGQQQCDSGGVPQRPMWLMPGNQNVDLLGETMPAQQIGEAEPLSAGVDHACEAECVDQSGAETNEFSSWWSAHVNSPGFDYERGLLSDEEVERLGYEYMPNGRQVDQPNFWDASAKVQNKYMQQWSVLFTGEQLALLWVSVGGLKSFNPKNVTTSGGRQAYTSSRLAKSSRAGYKYLKTYECLIEYADEIDAAVRDQRVNREALTAVLIFEISRAGGDPKHGFLAGVAARIFWR